MMMNNDRLPRQARDERQEKLTNKGRPLSRTQAIVLWHSKEKGDHRTCGGGAGCNSTDMERAGYVRTRADALVRQTSFKILYRCAVFSFL